MLTARENAASQNEETEDNVAVSDDLDYLSDSSEPELIFPFSPEEEFSQRLHEHQQMKYMYPIDNDLEHNQQYFRDLYERAELDVHFNLTRTEQYEAAQKGVYYDDFDMNVPKRRNFRREETVKSKRNAVDIKPTELQAEIKAAEDHDRLMYVYFALDNISSLKHTAY